MKLLLQRRRPLRLKESVSLKLLEKQLLMRLWPRAVTLNKRLKQRHKLHRMLVLILRRSLKLRVMLLQQRL